MTYTFRYDKKDKPSSVILIIFRHNYKQVMLSTKKVVRKAEWDNKLQRLRTTSKNAIPRVKLVNLYFQDLREWIDTFIISNPEATLERVKHETKEYIEAQSVDASSLKIDLASIINEYYNSPKSLFSSSTLKSKRNSFIVFLRFISEMNILDEVSSLRQDTIWKYKKWLTESHYNQNTASKYLNTVLSLCNWVYREKRYSKLIPIEDRYVPEKGLRIKQEYDNWSLNDEELYKIIRYKEHLGDNTELPSDEETVWLFLAMITTGKRSVDIREAKWRDFDLESNRWYTHDKKTKQVNDKNLNDTLNNYLKQRKLNGLSPFPKMNRYNNRIKDLTKRIGLDRTIMTINNKGNEVVTDSGKVYERISSKTCRHSAITYLRMMGIPKDQIMEFANHLSLSIHDNYGEHKAIDTTKYFDKFVPCMKLVV